MNVNVIESLIAPETLSGQERLIIINNPNFAEQTILTFQNGGEVDIAEQIIEDATFLNNDCLRNMYIQAGGAEIFATYLNNFDGDMSVANLKLAANPNLQDNVNAQTSPPENYLITLEFNPNNLDRPTLSIARTFIHELIHAEIFRKLLSISQHPSINLNPNQVIQLRNDYPGLYDYYTRWRWNIPQGQNPSSPQHEAMAQHYRGIIKNTLREFDPNQPEEVYDALSWVGLMGSGELNFTTGLYENSTVAWAGLNETERLSVISVRNNFNNSNPNCE